MAPKKCFNGFALYMSDIKQKLVNSGINMKMEDMPNYCKADWEKMSDKEKEIYKLKAKTMKNGATEKFTNLGENIEDVKNQLQENKTQSEAMYSYIEELVRVKPANHYLPKHKFILIHINPYTCDEEVFYFPAEISMAEFSLEKGLIRIFHQLIGFDPIKTKAPSATTADIHIHAKNNHKIGPYNKLSCNYMEILLKVLGFIIDKNVDEDVLNDPTIDIPPLYTAHTSTGKELMITNLSLFYLYKSVVQFANRNDFNRLLSVYHLDKLFMEMKNVSYEIKNPNKVEKALPSVAMATDSMTKDMIISYRAVGCNYHEELQCFHVCSNYYVCKWIYILSTHCCQYFNINLVPGCHYDFDLPKMKTILKEAIDTIHMSKPDYIPEKVPQEKVQTLTVSDFPRLGRKSTIVQIPKWNKPKHILGETVSFQGKDFPLLDNSQKVALKTSHVTEKNNWLSNANLPLDNFQQFTQQVSPVFGMNNWRSNASSQKHTPESLLVIEKDNWRSNVNRLFGNSKNVTPERPTVDEMNSWRSNASSQKHIPESLVVEKDNWRSNANRLFGNSKNVTPERPTVDGMNSWRSNFNPDKQLNENRNKSSEGKLYMNRYK